VQQQQSEAAELQRIEDVRQRQELDQLKEDSDRQWRKQEVIWTHQWREQERLNEESAQRAKEIEDSARFLHTQVEALWKVHQEYAQQRFHSLRTWQVRLEELSGGDGRKAAPSDQT
jgi:hypothetical protein